MHILHLKKEDTIFKIQNMIFNILRLTQKSSLTICLAIKYYRKIEYFYKEKSSMYILKIC